MKEFISRSDNETKEIAFNLSKLLKKGDVIEINGDLGAGKTVFTKGLANGLGILQTITSPTFNLVNCYDCPNGTKFYHFDLYRLVDIEELYVLGFEDIFNSQDNICIIEWSKIAEDLLPSETIKINITKISSQERKIEVVGL